jgi:hypothetical protein
MCQTPLVSPIPIVIIARGESRRDAAGDSGGHPTLTTICSTLIFSSLHAPGRFTSLFCFPQSGWYLVCVEKLDHSAMSQESKCINLVFLKCVHSLIGLGWLLLLNLLAIALLPDAKVIHVVVFKRAPMPIHPLLLYNCSLTTDRQWMLNFVLILQLACACTKDTHASSWL